jgi:ERCC4-type nuclease
MERKVKIVVDYRETAIIEIFQSLDGLKNTKTSESSSTLLRQHVKQNHCHSSNDKNEHERMQSIFEKMKDKLEWKVENLAMGDVHILTEEEEEEDGKYEKYEKYEKYWKLRMILERKQGQDLWQSIKDKRLKSQYERIETLSKDLQIVWVIENFKVSTEDQRVETVWEYITHRFLVNRSHQRHSIFWIHDKFHFVMLCLLLALNWTKEEKEEKEGKEENNGVVVLSSKKEFTTPYSFLVSVVARVPGISERLAFQIVENVLGDDKNENKNENKNNKNLTEFCQQLFLKEKELPLLNTGKEGGPIRKLGKKKVEKLLQLFQG